MFCETPVASCTKELRQSALLEESMLGIILLQESWLKALTILIFELQSALLPGSHDGPELSRRGRLRQHFAVQVPCN